MSTKPQPELAVGKEDILKILGMSQMTWNRYRKELHESGVIFYHLQGSPPRLYVKAFPSRLQRWLYLRSQGVFDRYFGSMNRSNECVDNGER